MNTAQVGRSHTISLLGLNGTSVLIEAALLSGLPNFMIVGLPDAAVNEAKERLRAAFQNVGLQWPNMRIVVNLSPADRAKSGTSFDLGIAAAILSAQGFRELPKKTMIFGELGLDGTIRAVRGILPAVLAAQQEGFDCVIVPHENCAEAQLVSGIEVTGVSHIADFAAMLGAKTGDKIAKSPVSGAVNQAKQSFDETGGSGNIDPENNKTLLDVADVCGQDEAIHGLEVAACGGHHVLLIGPPGVGKSMLSERFVGFLPDLSPEHAVEVAAIQSVFGKSVRALPSRPPYAAPHHTASTAALIGGGNGIPRPGAITRAHHGVLFCDEFPEFSTSAIQALRQPLESGHIELYRARARVSYPARFQLIAAANPCRCGYLLDANGRCTCTPRERSSYRINLGGPVRDRIDMRLLLRRPTKAQLKIGGQHSTAAILDRVSTARERQQRRNSEIQLEGRAAVIPNNAQLPGNWLRKNTLSDSQVSRMLENQIYEGKLSMRAFDRILRISWSLADLNGHDKPSDEDLSQAFILRGEEIEV
ncbi:magnesium chelatase family protein [Arcanobacterium pluranimalium]|uniref:YifB family Mg chelatase-like AAA ATPase n=1 Tax=Arcanobacterium pluranimalium TaxID=108028 RepID=UPI00195DBB28|nr:YifB family Mg chelatase-like AAA ATPase [Arcanobacterium pluranimalium]MBM7825664.1 magnesium chelatase family protein [Arcanobacterium pluranimalium]